MENYISGVLLNENSLGLVNKDNLKLVDILSKKGVLAGVDTLVNSSIIDGTNEEYEPEGLDSLKKRIKIYYDSGCRFARYRTFFRVSEDRPS
jgi:fructose-bisphosphate aldolase class I